MLDYDIPFILWKYSGLCSTYEVYFSQYVDFVKNNIHDDETARSKLFKDLQKALTRDSLVNASMVVQAGEGMESKRDNGLIVGHAYTIIRCYEVRSSIDTMYNYKMLVHVCCFFTVYSRLT